MRPAVETVNQHQRLAVHVPGVVLGRYRGRAEYLGGTYYNCMSGNAKVRYGSQGDIDGQ